MSGSLSVRHLDLAPILNDPKQKSDITADARVNLSGEALANVDALHGDIELDSPRTVAAGYVAERIHAKATVDGRRLRIAEARAGAYGATVTASGNITLPAQRSSNRDTAYDLRRRRQASRCAPPAETAFRFRRRRPT